MLHGRLHDSRSHLLSVWGRLDPPGSFRCLDFVRQVFIPFRSTRCRAARPPAPGTTSLEEDAVTVCQACVARLVRSRKSRGKSDLRNKASNSLGSCPLLKFRMYASVRDALPAPILFGSFLCRSYFYCSPTYINCLGTSSTLSVYLSSSPRPNDNLTLHRWQETLQDGLVA